MIKLPSNSELLIEGVSAFMRRWLASSLAVVLGITLLSGCSPIQITRASVPQPPLATLIETPAEHLMDPHAFTDPLETEPFFGTGLVALALAGFESIVLKEWKSKYSGSRSVVTHDER